MRLLALCLLMAVLAGCGGGDTETEAPASAPAASRDASALRYTMPLLHGGERDLGKYRGKVVLVVNTATDCGFTGQLGGLQDLYESRKGKGLVVLGFPSNDFGGQEPRSNEDIGTFCKRNYGVSFPMFAKTVTTGDDAAPLFQQLGAPSWNFSKYLLDRRGRLQERWEAATDPNDPALTDRIDALL